MENLKIPFKVIIHTFISFEQDDHQTFRAGLNCFGLIAGPGTITLIEGVEEEKKTFENHSDETVSLVTNILKRLVLILFKSRDP